MKRIYTSLLVALVALLGLPATAQTVTTYDFEDGNALFSPDQRITADIVEGTATIYNTEFTLDGKAVYFKGANNAQNGYCFAHIDFSSLCEQAAKVKVEFEAVLGNGARSRISIGDASVRGNTGNSSKNTYNNKGAIFMIGTEKSAGYVNGTGNSGLLSSLTQKWLKVTVEVDEIAKTYSYTIAEKENGTVIKEESDINFWSSDATNCTQIDVFGYINNSQIGLIDNIVITVTKDERAHANYTVKFVDESGNEIKEAATRDGVVGDGITLLPADMETFKNADGTMKYFYKSNDAEGKTVAEDGTTVVTVTYREAETWNYTVNFVNGETVLGSKTGNVFEGDQASVAYPKYLANEGALFMKENTNKEFNYKFTPAGNAETKTVEYNAVEGVTNVVYCNEAEYIEGMVACNSGNAGIRSSNSAAAYAPEDVTFTTLPAGKYNMYVSLFDATTNHNSSWTIKAGALNAATIACTAINFTEYPTNEFAVGKETPMIIVAGGNNTIGIDALYIVKTGDVTEEEAADLNAAAEAAEALAAAKAALEVAINEAKAIETEGKEGVDELNAAIAAAEAALAAEDATVETLNAAKAALDEAVAAFNEANTIKVVIANADFSESTPIDNNLCGYGKDMTAQNTPYYGLQNVTGWKEVILSGDNNTAAYPNSGMGGAVFAYGSEWQMKGNNVAAPAAGPNGEAGNALGFFAVWSCGAYYAQDVTLPAGKYTLIIPIYSQSGTQANESYTGFFVKDSDVKYTVAVNPTPGSWAMQTVTFTLDETTEGQIRLGYKSTGGGSGANPMIFIDGVQLMSELDAAIALYNTALTAAQAAATDEVVTGEEKDALNEVIAANTNIDMTSIEAVKAATDALNAAVETFNAAKGNYLALANAKAYVATLSFEYAAADKKAAAEEAATAVATSAADAVAKKDALFTAYRQYAESSALLEGKEDAVNMTDVIVNPAAESAIATPWTVVNGEGSNGSLDIKSAESWTDGNGNNTYKYFDGGNWGANAWDVTMKQDITLPAGKYQLTVKSRASAELSSFNVFAGEEKVEMTKIGASDGLFNRGWNDNSVVFELEEEATVAIGVQGVTTTAHNWMSFSDFRLVQFPAGGEVVGITNVNANDLQNGTTYNLRGQRVEKATKGLYIVNGKKVVIK